MSGPKVMGLDLSLTSTGVACSAGWVERVRSKGKADATLAQRTVRLVDTAEAILHYVTAADLVVVEAPAYDSRTGHQHDRSGLWWLVVEKLLRRGNRVVEVTTGGIKKYATGAGNADKDRVLAAVIRRYPNVEINGNDEADAWVLAAMGARALGHPVDDLPATHLAAMNAVKWPEVAA